jgi:hypothetical protein
MGQFVEQNGAKKEQGSEQSQQQGLGNWCAGRGGELEGKGKGDEPEDDKPAIIQPDWYPDDLSKFDSAAHNYPPFPQMPSCIAIILHPIQALSCSIKQHFFKQDFLPGQRIK